MSFAITAAFNHLFFGLPTPRFLFIKPIPYCLNPLFSTRLSSLPFRPVYDVFHVRDCSIEKYCANYILFRVACGKSEGQGDEREFECRQTCRRECAAVEEKRQKKKISGHDRYSFYPRTFRCYRHPYTARTYNPIDESPRGTRRHGFASSRNSYSSCCTRAVWSNNDITWRLLGIATFLHIHSTYTYIIHGHIHRVYAHAYIPMGIWVCVRARDVYRNKYDADGDESRLQKSGGPRLILPEKCYIFFIIIIYYFPPCGLDRAQQ